MYAVATRRPARLLREQVPCQNPPKAPRPSRVGLRDVAQFLTQRFARKPWPPRAALGRRTTWAAALTAALPQRSLLLRASKNDRVRSVSDLIGARQKLIARVSAADGTREQLPGVFLRVCIDRRNRLGPVVETAEEKSARSMHLRQCEPAPISGKQIAKHE
jgi:hypothetical protein